MSYARGENLVKKIKPISILSTLSLLFSLLLLSIFPLTVEAAVDYPEPSNKFYVFDEANLLSDETEKFILDVNKHYEDTNEKPQIVFVRRSCDSVDNIAYFDEVIRGGL